MIETSFVTFSFSDNIKSVRDKITIPVHIHFTWSAKRAHKDCQDRERILKKVKTTLEKPSHVNSQLKRGRNQYIAIDTDLNSAHLDEERIRYQEQFDGYYAIITNQLNYSTQEVTDIYGGLWKIEESFRILKSDLRARPVFVWKDEHIQGHFVLCFLSLSLIRYAQYLIQKKTGKCYSGQALSHALNEPMVLVQGEYPVVTVTPTNIPNAYFDVMKSLNMPELYANMSLAEFKKATRLDLTLIFK